jgi:hypothetical protein
MPHKQPTTSLADIHGIYQGPPRSAREGALPIYKRMPFSPRDEGHSGSPPERPLVKSKRKP